VVACLNGALSGLGGVTSARLDPAGSYEVVACVVPAWTWVRAWTILRTQLKDLGLLEDAHVSLFIIIDDNEEVEEERVLWFDCNVRDA
jgi:hypothetical protein